MHHKIHFFNLSHWVQLSAIQRAEVLSQHFDKTRVTLHHKKQKQKKHLIAARAAIVWDSEATSYHASGVLIEWILHYSFSQSFLEKQGSRKVGKSL